MRYIKTKNFHLDSLYLKRTRGLMIYSSLDLVMTTVNDLLVVRKHHDEFKEDLMGSTSHSKNPVPVLSLLRYLP